MKLAFPATTQAERELLLFFSICVAGKKASQVVPKVEALFHGIDEPFAQVRLWMGGNLFGDKIRDRKLGNYRKLERAMTQVLGREAAGLLDLATCSAADLTVIDGIADKTAKFYLLYSRPGEKVAALDVHVLRWLRRRGHEAPAQTPPPGKEYDGLEQEFLQCAEAKGLTPVELDAYIWDAGRNGGSAIWWEEVFADPDMTADAQYRAMYDMANDAVAEQQEGDIDSTVPLNKEQIDHLKGSLSELRDWCAQTLRKIHELGG